MELNEKAKVAALYQELSKADVSDPNKLVGQLESAAKSIVQSMNSHPIKDEQIKTSVFDHAHMNEQYRQLSEQQMKIVDSVQLLIKQVESMGSINQPKITGSLKRFLTIKEVIWRTIFSLKQQVPWCGWQQRLSRKSF